MENLSEIRTTLDRLSQLSDEELATYKDSVVSEFGTVRALELSEETANALVELADIKDKIVIEQKNRISKATELASIVEAAESRINADPVTETSNDDNVVENPVEAFDAAKENIEASSEVQKFPEEEQLDEDVHQKNVEESEERRAAAEDEKEDGEEDEEKDEEEDEDAEKKEEFSANESTTSTEAPVESETSTATPAEAELASTENTETNISEAELSASEEVNQESSEEPVTASINSEELDIQVPAGNAPVEAKTIEAPVTITAGADIPHIAAGSVLPDLKAVANALIARKQGMGRTSGGDGEFHQVATFTTTFPEDRFLTRNDLEVNRAKIDSVTTPGAITAAGGLYGPVPVRYELFGLGSTVRPVKNSLGVFGAERGGIRFVTPPVIADLTGAVSLWTLQDDRDAATPGAPDPQKPCLRVNPGEEVVEYLEAIPLCLTFGNMGARAYPELVERHTELAMVAHARFAETRLLTRLGAKSTAVTADAELGAARDIFAQIDQAAAAYRNRYRIDVNTTLRVIFPEWFKNALRADLLKQIPGDGNSDTFGLVEAKIIAWFRVRNIVVTWHMDGETGQMFGTQAAGALAPFPGEVIWYLFAEGTFLFLDGGTLDLGLVRDSTLNSTNDYKIFLETFEGLAKVGIESLRITSELRIQGGSAATVENGPAATV